MRLFQKGITALWALCVATALGAGAVWLVAAPNTPLPPGWNPTVPLDVVAPVTWFTPMKLRVATASPDTCQAALAPVALVEPLPPKVDSPQCGIDPRVEVRGVGDAQIASVETTCAVALRLALWERHVIQPAATAHFGQPVTALRHQGSYHCRTIRTSSGDGTRMSMHATAEAIDIKGVVLADGRVVDLLGNYDGGSPEAAFFRALRDGACTWFATTLGPEFNALHADHFHLQSRGWGTCR